MGTSLIGLISLILQILSLLIVARALASWFDPQYQSQIGQFLYNATEPIIGPIRQVIPSLGMIDISPIIALLLIQLLQQILVAALS
jgi:YggT family protein